MTSRVVIVGGGPVGLMTAILLAQTGRYEVTLVEKRATYARKQIVLLDEASLKLLPRDIVSTIWRSGNESLGCYVLPPPRDRKAVCYANESQLASVPLRVLENALHDHIAQEYAGAIRIVRPTVAQGKLDVEFDPDRGYVQVNADTETRLYYDVLVGADGAGSQVLKDVLRGKRKSILSSDTHARIYGLVINVVNNEPTDVSAADPAQRLRVVLRDTPQNKWRFFRRRAGGFYLGVVINQDEYEYIKQNKQVPAWVTDKISSICASVQYACKWTISDVTVFPVEPSYADKWQSISHNKYVFLVGDALVSTHYFTGSGLNVGLQSADNLATLLERGLPLGIAELAAYIEAQRKNIETIETKVLDVVSPNAPGLDDDEIDRVADLMTERVTETVFKIKDKVKRTRRAYNLSPLLTVVLLGLVWLLVRPMLPF